MKPHKRNPLTLAIMVMLLAAVLILLLAPATSKAVLLPALGIVLVVSGLASMLLIWLRNKE